MAPDGRTDGKTDGRADGRTDMDKPISLRLRRGIKKRNRKKISLETYIECKVVSRH